MASDRPVDGVEKAAFGSSTAAPWGHNDVEHGLTKRELFAIKAMQGLISCLDCNESPAWIAGQAVTMADALIVELCK